MLINTKLLPHSFILLEKIIIKEIFYNKLNSIHFLGLLNMF